MKRRRRRLKELKKRDSGDKRRESGKVRPAVRARFTCAALVSARLQSLALQSERCSGHANGFWLGGAKGKSLGLCRDGLWEGNTHTNSSAMPPFPTTSTRRAVDRRALSVATESVSRMVSTRSWLTAARGDAPVATHSRSKGTWK